MRSGAAAKARLDKIRRQRIIVDKPIAETPIGETKDETCKAGRGLRMVTPWCSRLIAGLEALSMLLLV
jgi:hypothetical protein